MEPLKLQKIGYHFFSSGKLTGGDRSLTRSPCRLSSVGRPILISVNARVSCTQVHVYQLTNNNQTDRRTDVYQRKYSYNVYIFFHRIVQ